VSSEGVPYLVDVVDGQLKIMMHVWCWLRSASRLC